MDDYESLSHSVWDSKYHVVFIPKYRKKTLYGELRRRLGDVFRTLARQKETGSRPPVELCRAHRLPRDHAEGHGPARLGPLSGPIPPAARSSAPRWTSTSGSWPRRA